MFQRCQPLKYGKSCMESAPRLQQYLPVLFGSIDDRVRELRSRFAAEQEAESGLGLKPVLSELRSALHRHAEQLRRKAATKLPKPVTQQPQEGRCRRLISPDGRIYWSFTWSSPKEYAVLPIVPHGSVCNGPMPLDTSKSTRMAKPFMEGSTSSNASCRQNTILP